MNQRPADITIDVFYELPLVLGENGKPDPNRSQNWVWTHALRIPVADLQGVQPFPVPYKCIRFASNTILNVPGRLSTSKDLSSPDIDYNAPLPDVSQTLYYHYAQDADLSKLFPEDPGMPSSGSRGTSNFSSGRRSDFRNDLLERDGRCCITGGNDLAILDAVHLVTRARGNEYYVALLRRRRDGVGENEREESANGQDEPGDSQDDRGYEALAIDDMRNGILLNSNAHRALSKNLGFLRTPNFAMDTTDIDPTATHPKEPKVFAQMLKAGSVGIVLGDSTNNVPLRLPPDTSKPPPPYPELFDYTYACAFLARFGVETVKADISERWRDHFYPNGAINETRDLVHNTTQKARNEKRALRAERRRQRADVLDIHDLLMLFPYSLIPPERFEAVMLAGQERQDAARKETVNHWLENVPFGSSVD